MEANELVGVVDVANSVGVASNVANLADFALFASVFFLSESGVEGIPVATGKSGTATALCIAQSMNVPTMGSFGEAVQSTLNRDWTRARVLSKRDRSSNLNKKH